jgi:hypothetical protein
MLALPLDPGLWALNWAWVYGVEGHARLCSEYLATYLWPVYGSLSSHGRSNTSAPSVLGAVMDVLGVVEEEDWGFTEGSVSAPVTRCDGSVMPCCAKYASKASC